MYVDTCVSMLRGDRVGLYTHVICKRTRCHVLRGIPDQGEEDDADERLADAVGLGHAVDGAHL